MDENRAIFDVCCFGLIVADTFCPPMPRLPDEGELLRVEGFTFTVGGCAANTGSDLAKLGLKVAVAGRVGDDVSGEAVLRELAGRGIDISGIIQTIGLSTSQTIILPVIGQDRRYVHAEGASVAVVGEDFPDHLAHRCRALYVGGYLVLPNLRMDALACVLREAKERGTLTVLDVIVPGDERAGSDLLTAMSHVLPYTDVFLPNDDEGLLITGLRDPEEQARAFVDLGAATAVVTLGAGGFVAATRERILRAHAYPVTVVDPSGAGDAFDAGIIYGLLHGWPLERTLSFGAALGASACRALGSYPGVYTLEEARSFVETHSLEFQRVA